MERPSLNDRELGWEELLSHLLDFQGHSVIVQVRHRGPEGGFVLAALGRMVGSRPIERDEETLAFRIASRGDGSNGLLNLRRDDFEFARRTEEDTLTIVYPSITVTVVRAPSSGSARPEQPE